MFFFKKINKLNNNTALILEKKNKKISYSKLDSYLSSISKKFKKNSLAFLLCKNNLETVACYLSLLRMDCAIVLLDEQIDNRLLTKLTNIYKPNLIFLPKKYKKNLKKYKETFIFFDYMLYKERIYSKKKIHPNLSLLISTSGSTGTPKLVKLSKNNLINNTIQICKYLPITKKDTTITTLPMSYVYGLSVINTHIYKGASILLNTRSIIEKDFWVKMVENKISSFSGVPYIYSLIEKLNLKNFPPKSLKYSTQAGGKLSIRTLENIINKYKKFNIRFFSMYGASETTSRMSYVPWNMTTKKKGSIGIPLKGGSFYLEDKNGKKINQSNKIGELVYSGKNVFMGYSNNLNDLSKGDVNNGIFKTGDYAYKDKDDYYFITGRKDRYIKIYGMRVNLDEFEDIITKYGVENICTQKKHNKILIYVKNFNKNEQLKKYLIKLTKLPPSSLEIKKIKKFKLNKNLKISYNELS